MTPRPHLADSYPGQSVVLCEMWEVWKGRNLARRLIKIAGSFPSRIYLNTTEYERSKQLAALRRIRRALREAGHAE